MEEIFTIGLNYTLNQWSSSRPRHDLINGEYHSYEDFLFKVQIPNAFIGVATVLIMVYKISPLSFHFDLLNSCTEPHAAFGISFHFVLWTGWIEFSFLQY